MGRRLGQHFLKDKKTLRKIVGALELKSGDVIVEIGPGHGELTREILNKFKDLKIQTSKVIAIEKDPTLVDSIEYLVSSKKLRVIEGDALKVLPVLDTEYKIPSTGYKLVGNIPYYITGHLLRIIGELKKKPKSIVLTLQKEVAERLTAGNPSTGAQGKMNLLAASVTFWGKPEIIGFISKKSFRPEPKVDSAIVKILPRFAKAPRGRHPPKRESEIYYGLIKILFKQPRKTILNNLSEGFGLPKKEVEEELKRLDFEPSSRGEVLNSTEINKLTASPLFKRAIIKRKA